MPRKKKLKAGDEAPCPQCRKLVALVQTDGGSLVLRTHHVVSTGESEHGYGVKECGSSGYPPASPSEVAEEDGWQRKAPQREGKPTAIGSTAAGTAAWNQIPATFDAAAVRNAAEGVSSLSQAIREATEEIIAAESRHTADGGPRIADMMRTSTIDPESIQRQITINEAAPEPVLSLRDVCQRIYQEIDPLLIRLTGQPQIIDVRAEHCNALSTARDPLLAPVRTANLNVTARPCGLDATFNIVPSAMTSEATGRLVAAVADRAHEHLGIRRTDEWHSGAMARVLNAVRDTYIDVTGAAPSDRDISVSVEEDFFSPGMQTLRLRLRPSDLVLQMPVSGELLNDPVAAEMLADSVAREVRTALLQRPPAASRYCNQIAQELPCACVGSAGHGDPHRCVCGHEWSGECP